MAAVPETSGALLARVRLHTVRTPDAQAVSAGDRTLSYRELTALIEKRSRGMRERGVRPGDLVGMCLARGIEPIVTALAAWNVGAAWVSLDTEYPVGRLQGIVDDAALPWVVIDGTGPDLGRVATLALNELDATGVGPVSPGIPVSTGGDTDLAYLIYTSGSTGVPKGVAVEHGSLRFFLEAFDRTVLGTPADAVWIAGAALSFDMCIPETFGALMSGGHVVVRRRLEPLAPLVERFHGTHLQCTPTQLALFMADAAERRALGRLRHIIVAGEALPVGLADELRSFFGGRFTNAYGPTEITVYATAQEIPDRPTAPIPVGRAFPGVICAVIDPETRTVLPPRMRGELVIAGPGVSRGYHRRPDLTERSFVPLPVGDGGANMRAYRSGDLAEIASDGTIFMFGRIDHQVKIRGQRIELGEIDAILSQEDDVYLAATVVVDAKVGDRDGTGAVPGRPVGLDDLRLVSHVVAAEGKVPDPDALRAACRRNLPEFMVPAAIVVHDALPYTTTGKIDRNSLASTGLPAVASDAASASARSDPDQRLSRLVGIWEGVIGVGVRPDDNFFELGGHSILGVELLIRVRSVFGRQLALGSLITDGTPRRMLAALDRETAPSHCLQQLRSGTGPATVIIHGAGGYLLRLYGLAQRITPGRPVYGLQAFGLHAGETPDPSTSAIADRYLGELALADLVDDGLAVIVGYSGGGIIAAEMAAHISERGGRPPLVIALDTDIPRAAVMSRVTYWRNLAVNVAKGGPGVLRTWWLVRRRRASELTRRQQLLDEAAGHGFVDLHDHFATVLSRYRPVPLEGPFGLVRVTEESPSERPDFGWRRLVRTRYGERTVDGDHFSILEEPRLAGLAAAVDDLTTELSA